MPSRRHPDLVPDFARRLAEALHGLLDWERIVRIGLHSQAIRARRDGILRAAAHSPRVEIRAAWSDRGPYP